jgi:hypothetical protein
MAGSWSTPEPPNSTDMFLTSQSTKPIYQYQKYASILERVAIGGTSTICAILRDLAAVAAPTVCWIIECLSVQLCLVHTEGSSRSQGNEEYAL